MKHLTTASRRLRMRADCLLQETQDGKIDRGFWLKRDNHVSKVKTKFLES